MNVASIRKVMVGKLGWGIVAGGITVLLIGALAVVAVLPAVAPGAGAQMADAIRSVLGPGPVAALESTSFAFQDAYNQFIAAHDGGQKAISLAQVPVPAVLPTPIVRIIHSSGKIAATAVQGSAVSGAAKLAVITNRSDVLSSSPQIGWSAYGPWVNGSPTMAQALLSLDPQRSYAGIALVRIDLSKLQLHMMPGSLEPSHAPDVVAALPHMGLTPAADQSRLVAAFNGGFKAVNGRYGMVVNGVTLLPPQIGLATLAIYKNGRVALGTWGPDIVPSADLVALRQNCPPIIEQGQINPQVSTDNPVLWGNTVGNRDITWRTAIGLSRDGRYLIYTVGNATSIDTLAQALLQAGAYNAMQLDINHPFAHFVTYHLAGPSIVNLMAVPLLNQMESNPSLYLAPNQRDYFYLTTP
jgi:hypothetical protein